MDKWLVPIIVALIAPLFIYLGVVRKLSGRISTSEASELWRERTALSNEYRQRAEECERQLKLLRNEIATVVARNTTLRRENQRLKREYRDAVDDSI